MGFSTSRSGMEERWSDDRVPPDSHSCEAKRNKWTQRIQPNAQIAEKRPSEKANQISEPRDKNIGKSFETSVWCPLCPPVFLRWGAPPRSWVGGWVGRCRPQPPGPKNMIYGHGKVASLTPVDEADVAAETVAARVRPESRAGI